MVQFTYREYFLMVVFTIFYTFHILQIKTYRIHNFTNQGFYNLFRHIRNIWSHIYDRKLLGLEIISQ